MDLILSKSNYILNNNFIIKYYESRSIEEIQNKVSNLLWQFNRSYAYSLLRNDNSEGKLKVKFGINEEGKVVDFLILESNIADKKLINEVSETIKKCRFSKIRNPNDITYVV
ncbi:MAG: AgmX/PglI C-terminal domain-containing protein [Candidatus Atribacteria bacterium]|nr:AgmX/PglI C-terminal domain-containing protein [Candidatus Atribacteria bacterium]